VATYENSRGAGICLELPEFDEFRLSVRDKFRGEDRPIEMRSGTRGSVASFEDQVGSGSCLRSNAVVSFQV
jgi:hypothetical protein